MTSADDGMVTGKESTCDNLSPSSSSSDVAQNARSPHLSPIRRPPLRSLINNERLEPVADHCAHICQRRLAATTCKHFDDDDDENGDALEEDKNVDGKNRLAAAVAADDDAASNDCRRDIIVERRSETE